MFENDSYFKKALSDFAFDSAYGDSIRHLYDKGYTSDQIKSYLGSPSLSIKKINEVIDKYKGLSSKNIPPDQNNNERHYEYAKVYDKYGHASFIKRIKQD
ncbi:MAG: hypothetical protein K6E98_07965 [Lachnospiraceae bacterium]|nr:hypothetical protein [Lachnospiraceae bacterium]